MLTHKNKATQHHEWGFLTMKRNAKTIIAGMIALAIFIADTFFKLITKFAKTDNLEKTEEK